jgi:transcriptional regulator with XRE-family HTH domain
MNPVEQLRKNIAAAHPDSKLTLTAPLNDGGTWHLDVGLADQQLIVEWNLATGFGLSSLSNDSFGERPDEAFRSIEDVQRRIAQLIANNERTSPPLGVLLSRLRERRGRTQKDLASKLGIRQASVSGFEHRNDIQFSTLRRIIEALGGVLEIFAVFPEARYRLAARSVECIDQFQTAASPKYALVDSEISEIRIEETFKALSESGALSRATKVAKDISDRHSILEVP